MTSLAPTDDPSPTTRMIRWIGLSIPTLLLTTCIAGVGWFLFPVLFPQIWANYLSRVQGKAELIVSAQQQLDVAWLSPDGRWLTQYPIQEKRELISPVVLNLMTGETWSFNLVVSDIRWIDAGHFIVYVGSGNRYYIVDASSSFIEPLNILSKELYLKPGALNIIEPVLRTSDQVYILETFGDDAGYKAITRKDEQWSISYLGYGYELGQTRKELETLISSVPHIDVPKYGWSIVKSTGDHVFSPDGRFYVTRRTANRADVNERAEIYTSDGQLVAHAYKAGWTPYVLGWAHDGSGAYVQFRKSGGAASMFVPYKPLFKLSPLSPEESRWQLAQTIVRWVIGIAIVGAAGWWFAARRKGWQR